MKKKWLLIAGAAVVLIVFVVLALRSSGVKRTKVTVELAKKGEITSLVTATGKVKAQADVDISADVMGRIEQLPVKEGELVKEGQLLVMIDDRSRRMDVAQARGSLQSAISARDKAKIDLDRVKQLFSKKLSSQSDLDFAQNTNDQAEAQVQVYQANLDRAQDQLSKCTIRAPMDGIITKLNSEKGENVIIGTMNSPGTIIMIISDLSAIEIEAEVDETDIARVALDQKVVITLDAFPDTTFAGKVIEIGNSPQAASYAGTDQITNFIVKVLILDKVVNIKPGMTASVDITTNAASNIIKVPSGAVVMRPEGTGEKKEEGKNSPVDSTAGENDSSYNAEGKKKKDIDGIFKVEKGQAKFVPVKLGIRDQQNVEIIQGISQGDSIITGPYRLLRTLKPDVPVDPQKPKFGPDMERENE